ncbi:MAG: hypothetical protein Kow00133_12790 [Amphiplicatus sp.]
MQGKQFEPPLHAVRHAEAGVKDRRARLSGRFRKKRARGFLRRVFPEEREDHRLAGRSRFLLDSRAVHVSLKPLWIKQ